MRFRLEHPTSDGGVAEYGIDHAIGYFVTFRAKGQRPAEYDRMNPGYADLDGALSFLAKHGFFSQDALIAAKEWLADEDRQGSVAAEVHRAATVICNLKEWPPPKGGPNAGIAVGTRLKVNQVRWGPNKLFDRPDDRGADRNHLPEDECIQRFGTVWESSLGASVAQANEIQPQDARDELNEKQLKFFDERQAHREFWLSGLKFVAQLRGEELTQLWAVRSSDHNPRALWLLFSTKEERETFGRIASALGWNAEELGLKLLRDFMETTRRVVHAESDRSR